LPKAEENYRKYSTLRSVHPSLGNSEKKKENKNFVMKLKNKRTLLQVERHYRQNIHYGWKNADLVKMLFTSQMFYAKLSVFQKEIHFGCLFGYPKKAEKHAFLPAAPFLAACVFG